MRIAGPTRSLFNLLSWAARKTQVRRRRPQQSFEALRGSVEVVTDTSGVPHIFADYKEDLFFAQGYVTARDRLFQLDYVRHAARGRICELVGRQPIPWRQLTVHLKERTTFDVDVMMRTFGIERAAELSLEAHSSEARGIIDAYTAGFNAYLAQDPWTLEHRILRLAAKPWTALDSIVMLKGIGFELNYAWRSVLLGALLDDAGVPDDIARVIWPHYPKDAPCIVDSEAWKRAAADAAATYAAAGVAHGKTNRPGAGSNAFCVAASHSKTGEALLANDTHMNLTVPVPWHEVHLSGAGYDLQGFALAGVPGVAIGRTPHHAWGITAGLVHDLDLFMEKLDPDDPTRYRTPDGWADLEARDEVFHVRGEGHTRRQIYSSRHGPLLETLATQPDAEHRFSICWTGHSPSAELDALLKLWSAQSYDDVRAGFLHHGCPTFNISYADVDGHIAYMLVGKIPKRKPGTPVRPLEGWTGEWDWDGIVPWQENPSEVDPPRGFSVTANNRVGPWDYPHELGDLFEPPERFERITERLTALGKGVTFEDMAAIQLDTHSAWGLLARDAMLGAIGGIDGLQMNPWSVSRAAAKLWESWDGDAGRDSAGATIGYLAPHYFGDAVVRQVGNEEAAMAFIELSSFVGPPILNLLTRGPRLAELGCDLKQMIRTGFERAVQHCRRAMGNKPTKWRWGDIHPLECKHRFDSNPMMRRLFTIGPVPEGGGPDTVRRGDMNLNANAHMKLGASMRMVVAVEQGRMETIVPGGQSGRRLSKHYDDQVKAYVAGKLKTTSADPRAIDVENREKLTPTGR